MSQKLFKNILLYFLTKVSINNQLKYIIGLISILLLYFFQLFVILDKILAFNCDGKRYGICVVHNCIKIDESELYLLDDIKAIIDTNEKYYRNNLNYYTKKYEDKINERQYEPNIRNDYQNLEY